MLSLLAIALQVTAVPSIDAENAADLRCLAVVSMALSNADAETKTGLTASAMYFVGRIDSRSPGFNYRGEMVALITSGSDLRNDATRCGALLQQRGATLVELGKALQNQSGK